MIQLLQLVHFINYLVLKSFCFYFAILVESLINLGESIGKVCAEDSIEKLKSIETNPSKNLISYSDYKKLVYEIAKAYIKGIKFILPLDIDEISI